MIDRLAYGRSAQDHEHDTVKTVNQILSRVDGAIRSVSAAYTMLADDMVVIVDASGGPVTVTLAAAKEAGKIAIVKDDGSAGSNTVTISGPIDGGSSVTITSNYGVRRFLSDGSGSWLTI